ncbi:MAG: hypothetical protein BTN85_0636 [Candidatus Methanohalarchaeum thermophilum]|uniref:Uncharacterized protein n=1 Tax=Methanohalarchaeum thermophilum TaxID=1903181 RepID=A0A1Q6DUV1_METT1|nr:MAG: hypothetical protein BTN85_0636 [Candidatus Methanohalarchaeum thermophilum]
MSLLDKIFGRKNKSISLSEAFKDFNESIKGSSGDSKKKNELKSYVDDIKENIERLEESSTPDEMGRNAEQIKNDYCRRARNILNNISYSDLEKFLERVRDLSPSPRESKYLSYFFEEEVKALKNNIRALIEKAKEIKEEVGATEEEKKILEELKDLDEIVNSLKSKRNKLSRLKEELDERNKDIQGLEEEISEIDISKEKKIKKTIQELEEEKKETKKEISAKLGFLSRILRKYEYETNKDIPYADNPHLIPVNKDIEYFEDLIDRVYNLVSDEKIELDQKKTRKLNELKKGEIDLKSEIEKLNSVADKIKEKKKIMEAEIKPKRQKISKLEGKISTIKEEKEELKHKKQKIGERKDQLMEKKKNKISEIIDSLEEYTNCDIKLDKDDLNKIEIDDYVNLNKIP